MSYVKIMVHAVWGTHTRQPILVAGKREELFRHIISNAKTKDIYIDSINGYLDHMHCLISLGSDQTIAKVIQLIKGESSHWANKNHLFSRKLEWAEDYFAASVGKSAIMQVRGYILNQEEHHRKVTFAEEYEKFIKSHGFSLG